MEHFLDYSLKRDRNQIISLVVLTGSYLAAQMLADIGSLKIALVGSWAIDAGTFIYPLTFSLRDMIHKRLGKTVARICIILAAVINLFMALYFWLVSLLPPDPDWALWEGSSASLNDAFSRLMGPVWIIVLASIAAKLISELLDTEVYQFWVSRVTRRFQWSRVLVSNAVSIPVDSLVFCWLAFGWGMGLPAAAVWQIFWFNVLVKGAITLLSLPSIYLVKDGEGLKG